MKKIMLFLSILFFANAAEAVRYTMRNDIAGMTIYREMSDINPVNKNSLTAIKNNIISYVGDDEAIKDQIDVKLTKKMDQFLEDFNLSYEATIEVYHDKTVPHFIVVQLTRVYGDKNLPYGHEIYRLTCNKKTDEKTITGTSYMGELSASVEPTEKSLVQLNRTLKNFLKWQEAKNNLKESSGIMIKPLITQQPDQEK